VKSNIGHAQHAAGAAGVIKMILALQHETLPRTLHVEEPSPHVEWSAGDVRLLTEPVPWPAGGGKPRRVGISSFGMSGTNAHVILADPPAEVSLSEGERGAAEGAEEPAAVAGGSVLTAGPVAWVVSGKTAAALAGQAGRLADLAASRPGLDPADVAWSLATTRSTFEHRAVVTGTGRDELVAGLAALAAGKPASNVVSGALPPGGDPGQTVFVFPGQGTQWAGMGVELAQASPVFAARLAECSSALEPLTGWRVEEMLANTSALERVEVVQPVLWAVMVSLAAVWEAAGVTPAAVAGHSQGEIAASVVAGILSLEDAARVVALRSRSMRALAGKGGMASLALPADAVRERIAAWPGRLSVAAVNSPGTTVVSGDPAAIELLVEACKRDGVRTLILLADCAGHGPQVEALEAEVIAALDGIVPGPARVPMVSAMTGKWLDGPELDAAYWYASMRAPVEFERSVRVLAESGHLTFIEVSPHPVLAGVVTETERRAVVTGTLRNGRGGAGRLLASLGQAHVAGVRVDWATVLPAGRMAELPTYAFQHQHFWPRPSAAPVVGGDGAAAGAEASFWAAVEDGDVSGLADVLAVDRQRPFSEVVPALASWRHRERAESTLASWRYQVTWAPVASSGAARLAGPWLLLIPAGHEARADEVAAAMIADGARLATITIETCRANRAELATLVGAALTGEAPAGVVSLLALDESPLTDEPALPAGAAGTLALVQALGDAEIGAPLWVLTSGAVGVLPGEAPAHPVQALIWGFGRVAALEHPDRWGGLIDLPPGLDQQAGRRLSMLLAGCGEDQAAIREAGAYGRRMTRAAVARAAKAWIPGGSALLTGGTGAIGGHVARWLASRGTPRVILASRSGPAASGAGTLAADLAAAGTTVQVCACDSASEQEISGLLTRIAASGPSLAAVFHAAGVPQATTITEMSVSGMASVLAVKTTGAACLDELTRDIDLEAFVLFSSGAATWGSGEQGGYAAANAYLDALAEARRARGLAATSTAWGGWGGGGMTSARGVIEAQRRGIGLMDPQLAVRALAQILDAGENAITIADIDWARFTPTFTIRRPSPLLSALPEAVSTSAEDTVPSADAAAALGRQLAGLSPAEQEHILTDLVRGQVAAVLGHASAQAIEPDQAFSDLGFDSVTAIEFRNRLSAASGLQLPTTIIYDHPTPVALSQYLRTQSVEYKAHYEFVIEEISKLESSLSLATWDDEEKLRISTRLEVVARGLRTAETDDLAGVQEFNPATDDEMFSLVDEELRISDFD
jgi:acyl transferase domain-containing protein